MKDNIDHAMPPENVLIGFNKDSIKNYSEIFLPEFVENLT